MYALIKRKITHSIFTIITALTLLLPWALHAAAEVREQSETEFSIIMYHHLSPKQKLLNDYVLSVQDFENDLKYLSDRGYETINVAELISHVRYGTPIPEKPVMITFDDGCESFLVYAVPLLKQYGMKAVVSVVGSYADEATKVDDHNVDYSYLTWEQISELQKSGIAEIQNHSYKLHRLDGRRKGSMKRQGESKEAYQEMLRADLSRMQQQLFECTGVYPSTFTYPFGLISPGAREVVEDMGFDAAFNCRERKNVIRYDNTQWLYSLNRYNRPHGKTSEAFFRQVFPNETP